ncbi:DUF3109 family protein [Lewinella sp. JB7]|uniref:DUF3109 family protein n=1 Tax=Lewinella sp. JB7 TaxID=2962887 RepID=UPI0020C9B053|nr:DUF3109 family protein [Lewinella sp. JB7]MCP9236302.1 DUF3109 family protein [Lewinella sp. JB7]
MYIIGSILVSDDIVQEQFACNIAACKGACCWEGDYGAPLENDELPILDALYPAVAPYLTDAGRAAIAEQGTAVRNGDGHDTPLVDGGACAYMTLDGTGTAQCGIEQAYNAGDVDWKKPISCHLYPIRVKRNPQTGFEALNYDVWDICSAACTRGERERIRIYEFAKPALIRKYGEEWYAELVAAVEYSEE